MYQLIGATAFCLAAAASIWSGDPILGILLVVCAIAWLGTALAPLRGRQAHKRISS
jgi:hypothetical protein